LKLIKEDKIKKLVFLSTGDERKYEVFRETFGKPEIAHKVIYGEGRGKQGIAVVPEPFISLRLMSEERKKPPYPQTKVDWVEKNASNFDIFIDDNPFICNSLMKFREDPSFDPNHDLTDIIIVYPYYPAIMNQHHKWSLPVKQEVSNLKKEDFKNDIQ